MNTHGDTARSGPLILAGIGAPNRTHRLHSMTTVMGQQRREPRGVPLELPCRRHDPELWFADAPADLERAKQLCAECPLRLACLALAVNRAEFAGVWGGHIFERGQIVPVKRARGRPRKQAAPTPAEEQDMTTRIAPTARTSSEDRVHSAAARLFRAECALHTAHQSRVDIWIDAANRKLHDAVQEYLAAVDARPANRKRCVNAVPR